MATDVSSKRSTITDRRDRNPAAAALIIAAVTIGVAGGGALATDPNSLWYRELEKPSFNPPSGVFGPVWTTIYILTAISAWLAWRDVGSAKRRAVLWLFAANAALNLGWTLLFFRARAPWAAAIEIIPLFATIIALIWSIRPWNRAAALALVPYAGWTAFATVLTWAIALENS